jgi:secreted trypsin-like serine protease
MISEQWILTAAHCSSAIRVFIGDNVAESKLGINTFTVRQAKPVGSMLALLQLHTSVPNAQPAKVAAMSALPKTGTLVAFGFNTPDGGFGQKRSGTIGVTAIGSDAFFTSSAPQDICPGDSGGGVSIDVNGGQVVVGIAQGMFGGTCGSGGICSRITSGVITAIENAIGHPVTVGMKSPSSAQASRTSKVAHSRPRAGDPSF